LQRQCLGGLPLGAPRLRVSALSDPAPTVQKDESVKQPQRFPRQIAGVAWDDLPTLKSAPNRDQFVISIEKCNRLVQAYKGGHVVLGRIVLDGPGDPRDVAAPNADS
jgi:hypothetical protein